MSIHRLTFTGPGAFGLPTSVPASVSVVGVDLGWTRDGLVQAYRDEVRGGEVRLGDLVIAADDDGTQLLAEVLTMTDSRLGLRIIEAGAEAG